MRKRGSDTGLSTPTFTNLTVRARIRARIRARTNLTTVTILLLPFYYFYYSPDGVRAGIRARIVVRFTSPVYS